MSEVEMIESIAIADTFVSGLGKIENAGGGCLRFYYYAQQGGDRVMVAKLIIPAAALPAMIAIREAFCAAPKTAELESGLIVTLQ